MLVLFVAVISANAQTLKWSVDVPEPVALWATDGAGGLAYCYYSSSGEIAHSVWLDSNGHVVFTNDFSLGPHGGGAYAIPRFTRTELAVQLYQSGESGSLTNVLRRFKRQQQKVQIIDVPLSSSELMDSASGSLTDAKGFFTRIRNNGTITFRRYSN
jgi:hypothetical protein